MGLMESIVNFGLVRIYPPNCTNRSGSRFPKVGTVVGIFQIQVFARVVQVSRPRQPEERDGEPTSCKCRRALASCEGVGRILRICSLNQPTHGSWCCEQRVSAV